MNDQPSTPPPLPVRKRFPWIWYGLTLGLIVLVALAPIFAVILCSIIASAYGCKVDEGSVHPCMIHGKDYGEQLYTLGVSGWFMLATLPLGALAGAIWLAVLILHRSSWRKRQVSSVLS
ncbi:MAG TPA: hypothetical protein VH207_15915 [Chthoniobacterales bacterium]|jgi:hypothetical protein|nr:hypothetical protein [Chthoniobacterales bacterium]